jgi:hypothetical protein
MKTRPARHSNLGGTTSRHSPVLVSSFGKPPLASITDPQIQHKTHESGALLCPRVPPAL